MRPPVPTHPDDDRLLELAYGELPASEARSLRQHVDGCARCRQVLDGIAEVRTAFRSIPGEPPPERGLESLLAYGEQAAARARSRRSLRILGLLSAAAAFAVVWVIIPRSPRPADSLVRAPASSSTDMLAQAEGPRPVAQGDRARDELDDAKDAKQKERKAPAQPLATSEPMRVDFSPAAEPARRAEAETPQPKEKAVAKLDAPKEQRQKREQPASPPSDLEVASRSAPQGNAAGGLTVGGKVGAAGSSAVAGAGTLSSESASGAAKKRAATGQDVEVFGSSAGSGPASPPAAAIAAARPPAPSQPKGEEGRIQEAARVAAAPMADAVASEDKALSTAKTSAKPAPMMQSMRVGAGSPEKTARLDEVKRQLTTATGDVRKGLLMEQCELEASLQRGPDAVLSCSKVTQEFPGTPEAQRAGEIARGFSVQLPAKQQER
ncbi:MAG TPA: zf-HC2 domain-containing protein [Myxococcaceae bacterium]|nr:zf-HC2 domain-containing protein [Myxococcaceae bacterium]